MSYYVLLLCSSTSALLAATALPAASASNGELAAAVEQFCHSQQKKGVTSGDVKKLCSHVEKTKSAVRSEAGFPDSTPFVPAAAHNGYLPPASYAAPPVEEDAIRTGSAGIIRRDRSQIFEGFNPLIGGQAPGAAISFTDNHLKNTQTVSIDGFASYSYYFQREALPGPNLQSAGIATWVSSAGKVSLPENPRKPEYSALQAGIEGQAFVYHALPGVSLDLGASPYYQTDFLGRANIGGFTFHVRPTYEPLHINFENSENDPVAYRIMLFGEVNAFYVDNPGLTNYRRNTGYAWMGGTAQLRLSFFNGTWLAEHTGSSRLNDFLQKRLYANATMLYYADANSSDVARDYEVEIGYNLGDVKAKGGGQSSISVAYSNGNNISLLTTPREQVKVRLNYKY